MLNPPRSWFLVLAALSVVPAQAKRSDIVPVEATGVTVVATAKGPVARATLGKAELEMRLSTRQGFVYLDVTVKNGAAVALKISPESLKLEAAGVLVDPLNPDQYVRQRFERKPYPIDENGKINEDEDATGHPVYKAMAGAGLPAPKALADAQPKPKVEEKPHATLFGGGTGKTIRSERRAATQEWLVRAKDILMIGGKVAPGQSASAQAVYQRNGLELPLVATFQPEDSDETVTVRFIRTP